MSGMTFLWSVVNLTGDDAIKMDSFSSGSYWLPAASLLVFQMKHTYVIQN